jgi:NADPH2:quinone reductase
MTDTSITSTTSTTTSTTATDQQPVTATAWLATRHGNPGEVLERGTVEVPAPGPNEIRVAVRAFCLNFNDIDCIQGRYATIPTEPPFVPGMEVVGTVEAAGPGAEGLLGRRTVAIPTGALGGYASHAIAPSSMALELPRSVDDTVGAAIHYPFHLSWLALHDRAHLSEGETLLVHAAAGGVGSAAIQLGKLAGATVIATAGSEEKLGLCRHLGADHVVNYRTGDFTVVAEEVTHGRGVDVAFDTVGGEVTQQTFRCMGFGGRHLLVGLASGIEQEDQATITPRPLLYGNFSVCGVCHVYVDDPVTFRRLTGLNFTAKADGLRTHATILRLLEQGKIRPVIGRELPFEDIPSALEAMARRETTGRLVVHLPT